MTDLKAEVLSHFNEPVLIGFDLGRIIGYAEDAYGCYMIVKFREETIWQTMVGGYYYLDTLKNQSKVISTTGEHWNDFTRLDTLLEKNGVPKRETPIITNVYRFEDYE